MEPVPVIKQPNLRPKRFSYGRLWNWFRLLIGLSGLGLVIYSVAREDALLDTFLSVDLWYIFIAFTLTIVATIIKTWRWALVLTYSQVQVTFQRLFGTYLVGTFFSQFMPGSSMGGDAMRMVEMSADSGRTLTSVSSVLVERVIGLLTIIVSASAILILIPHDELTGTAAWWTLHILSVLGIIGLVILRMGWFVEPIANIMTTIKLGGVARKITMLSQALRGQLGETSLLVKMVVLSFLANAATMTAAYMALLSLGKHASFFSFIPLIALTVAIEIIPISPGALGLREATYVAFFTSYLDIPQSVALATALLVRGIGLALGVIGGVVFIARTIDKTAEAKSPPTTSSSPPPVSL
jgi:uncharacterized protein (TIRG00374 family)